MTGKRQLLVVDDEHLILQIISDIFSNEGYEVFTALNCDKALQLLKDSSFNVVLTDIRMPEKNGIDLLERIRELKPDIPVILMTGFASLETALEAVKHGAYDYLTKPLDFNKLKSIIKHAADKYDLLQENRRLVKDLQEINSNLELKVKERNRDLENILNSTYESIITTDLELIIKSANPQTTNIFGKDYVGLKLSELLKGINFEKIIPQILSDPSYTSKHEIKYGDKFLEITLSQLVDFETGEKFGITVVTEEITEKKKLEAQLIQSAKMSGVGQFAAGLAHEFNNILSGIMGYTSFALSRTSIEKIKEDLKVVEKASARASEIVTTLLSFSKQKEGKKQLSSLEEIIEDALQLLEHTFKADGIQILRHYGKIPPIVMNVGEIQQVLINMALNSRDAMSEGGVIGINAELVGDNVKIEFSDNGIGIPKKNLQGIFEPFFTTKKSEHSKSGTGLGLSVAYSIIERHNGRIEVSSEVGKGTTFTIWLPNIQRLSNSEDLDSVEKDYNDNILTTRRKANILVVDDEQIICDLISEGLADLGHNIDTANRGDSAIEFVKKNHYDIIFSDLKINGKSGLELVKELRVFDPSSVVVIVSGTPEEDILNRFIAEGAFSFIQKPFKISEIQKVVARILGAD